MPLGAPVGRAAWLWAVSGVVGAIVFAGCIGLVFRDHTFPTGETIAYEATMPGLAEELCWRGLVFVFLTRAYALRDGTANLVPAAVATLLFGLLHGFNVDNGSMRLAWVPFAYASIFGAGMMPTRSGRRRKEGPEMATAKGSVYRDQGSRVGRPHGGLMAHGTWPLERVQGVLDGSYQFR